VVAPRGVLTHVSGVFFELQARGVELVFAAKTRHVERVRLPEGLVEGGGASVVKLPLRRIGTDADAIKALRLLADYVRFLDPTLPQAGYPRSRIAGRLRSLGVLAEDEPSGSLPPDAHVWLQQALRRLEELVEPQPALEQAVAELAPDGMLLVTRCSFGGSEPDAIKVARRLGLPSIMLVWSWDNLSSKAVLQEQPDRLLVWNDVQCSEAVELHGIPAERVEVVGAANFDRFFEEFDASPGRGDRDGRPATILYLGSSPNIAADEPEIFDRWRRALRSSGDRILQEAAIVVRPHPASVERWRAWPTPEDVTLAEPRAKVEHATLARLLGRADVVVALNTSAEIEAAIAGCPVVTFRAGADAPGQEGSLHFSYLLTASDGFVVDSPSLESHTRRLGAVLRGDFDRGAIDRFVERFVRPRGIDAMVSPIVAATVVDLIAAGRPVAA
jgi:hypothetical protein